jgi:hypothetical protein
MVGTMTSQVERIAAMEVRLFKLEETVVNMDKKLDDLLALKYKGQGMFLLASAIFGTGIIGTLYMILGWFKGH